MRSW